MTFTEIYKFQWTKYDKNGFHLDNGLFFLDTLKEWEIDFHNKHPVCFANHVFSNSLSMLIFNKCYILDKNENCGVELIDGEIDFDTNDKIEEKGRIRNIYGVASNIEDNKDEPLWLIVDDKLMDGTMLLKYIPDDDPDETEVPIPTESDRIKV